MNDKKIAFIMCANDEMYVEECLYYINRLLVPEGFELDFFSITDSRSMCQGYQKGMEQSDAKYKIYLHQDTFIIDVFFLQKMLHAFEENEKLGLLGVIGTTKIPYNGYFLNSWNIGKIYDNIPPFYTTFEEQIHESSAYHLAEVLDGLILMTQYDVLWNESVFDGWDFYDASYAMEIKKMGLEVGVLTQETPSCYHCNHYSRISNYYVYQKLFCKTYLKNHPKMSQEEQLKEEAFQKIQFEKETLGEQLKKQFEQRLRNGELNNVLAELRQEKQLADFECLKEFKLLQLIDDLEVDVLGKSIFLGKEKNFFEIQKEHKKILFFIKRIEFHTQMDRTEVSYLKENYTSLAILAYITLYVRDKEKVKKELGYFKDGYLWKV